MQSATENVAVPFRPEQWGMATLALLAPVVPFAAGVAVARIVDPGFGAVAALAVSAGCGAAVILTGIAINRVRPLKLRRLVAGLAAGLALAGTVAGLVWLAGQR